MTQMKLTGRFALLALLAVVAATSIAAEKKGEKKKAKKPAEFKATCPVLGELAEKDALMMYRGKKLYFCCQSCPDIFNATPKVYTTAVHLHWFQTGEIAQAVAVAGGGVKVKGCCPGCAKKLAALKGDKKVAAVFASLGKGFTLQAKCAVSGKPINTDHVITFQKQKVWFCCPKCKKAFLANPKKFLAKLPQLKTKKKAKKK